MNTITNNTTIISSVKIESLLEDISIESLEEKKNKIIEIINIFMLLLTNVKSNIVDIKIILAKEKEQH